MNKDFLHFPADYIVLKLIISLFIGMLIGLERKWSHKEAGIRTFSIVSLVGTLATLINSNYTLVCFIGVFLLIVIGNVRSFFFDHTIEITTAAALIADYTLGVLVGKGHIFTPVAGAIIITMLLAWKTELNKFAGGLSPSEIRSAILLGLIGFVIYPILPNKYIDPWKLFNPSDVWISIIAIAGIGFLNYIFLKLYSAKGLYLSAIFGGLINSTATIMEISSRVRETGESSKIISLSSLINISMFTRNMLIAAIFIPFSLTATLFPLLTMSLVAGIWIWKEYSKRSEEKTTVLRLASPISLKKIISFGLLFVVIQIGGTLLTNVFGDSGTFTAGFFGGLISSASTTAAAATMSLHGKITSSMVGNIAIVSSMASTLIDLPIIWKNIHEKKIIYIFTFRILTILFVGLAAVIVNHYYLSDKLAKYIP